jgi:hypothetical protein
MGNFEGRLKSCEENIVWIRNFLITSPINSNHFEQHSDIKINKQLDNLIPQSWKEELNSVDVKNCRSPFDCIIKISNNQGLIKLKQRANKLNTDINSFLLALGVYLYEKVK